MGLFKNWFGKKDPNAKKAPDQPALRDRYNVMTSIALFQFAKHQDASRYTLIENGIYVDLTDPDEAKYRMAMIYQLDSKPNNNNQYPLEDILDKYMMFVSESMQGENEAGDPLYIVEFGGYLEHMKQAQELLGKTVFNRDFLGSEGKLSVDLVIE